MGGEVGDNSFSQPVDGRLKTCQNVMRNLVEMYFLQWK